MKKGNVGRLQTGMSHWGTDPSK